MDADIILVVLLIILIVVCLAILVFLVSQGYIHTEHSTAVLSILTGQNYARWPQQKSDIARVEQNIQQAWDDVDDAPRRLSTRVKPVVKTPMAPTLPPQKASYISPDLSHTLDGTFEQDYYGGKNL